MIYALQESTKFWNSLDKKARACSLAASKFVHLAQDHDSKIDTACKKTAIEEISKGEQLTFVAKNWEPFLTSLWENNDKRPCELIFATPEAPLLINLSGGVMENAGLSLDLMSGVPFIPGSAVKGCTRRMAIWELSQESNPDKKSELLAKIALIFGWGDQEWNSGRDKKNIAISDFWLAMAPYDSSLEAEEADRSRNNTWDLIKDKTQHIIGEYTHCTQKNGFAGIINFLPSYPNNKGSIECDIITPHHKKYYENLSPQAQASDTEDPIPINLPRLLFSEQAYFSFAVTTAKPKDRDLLLQAKAWLMQSLGLFGIGAKTSAGYGWFSFPLHETKLNDLKENRRKRQKQEQKQEQKEAEQAAKQANMTPLELKIDELSQLDDSHFAALLKSSLETDDTTKQALVFLFQTDKTKKKKYKTWTRKKPELAKIIGTLLNTPPQA